MLNVAASSAEGWKQFAVAAYAGGRFEEALAAFEQTALLDPMSAAARHNVGLALFALRRYGEAVVHFRRSVEMEPRLGVAWNSIGAVLLEMGRPVEAVAALREGVGRDPGNAGLHSFLMCAMAYADASAAEIGVEAEAFGKRFRPVARPAARRGSGRLRVGYVSGDLREHAVAAFLLPVLKAHDRRAVETFCYSHGGFADGMTERLRGAAEHWRDIAGFTDDQAAAAVIRNDGIDVLVDLMGHTAGNRLGIFARRPAAAQVSWLGYSGGATGLAAMDFRLVDRVIEPGAEGATAAARGEAPYVMGRTFGCYAPPAGEFKVERKAGPPQFAAFHNPAKVSDGVLGTWNELLRVAPEAGLTVILPGENDETARRIVGAFVEERRGRVRIVKRLDLAAYMEAHREVDVLLDTFPLSGHTVTCHALYMGVAVVTLRGAAEKPAWQRLSSSVLMAVDRPEWIAGTPGEYVEIAARLVRRPPAREAVRKALVKSAVMDGAGFARGLETAYRDIFRRVTGSG